MKQTSIIAGFVFCVVGLMHLLRIVFTLEVVVGGTVVPMWISGIAALVAFTLATALWRGARNIGPQGPAR